MSLAAEVGAHLGLVVFSVLAVSLMVFLAYWMLRPEAF